MLVRFWFHLGVGKTNKKENTPYSESECLAILGDQASFCNQYWGSYDGLQKQYSPAHRHPELNTSLKLYWQKQQKQ